MAFELYQILNIPKNASQDEIKKAYYKLVRQFPPEKQPEQFKKIRSAYQTLKDSKQKIQYDEMQKAEKYSAEITMLSAEGMKAIEESNWNIAIQKFKHILALAPKLYFIHNQLGIAYSVQSCQAFRSYVATHSVSKLPSPVTLSAIYNTNIQKTVVKSRFFVVFSQRFSF